MTSGAPGLWYRRWTALSHPDRVTVGAALAVHTVIAVALRTVGSARVAAAVERWSATGSRQGAADLAAAVRVGQIVDRVAAHRVPGGTCLTRSLTSQAILRRRGVRADLRLGVRPTGSGTGSGTGPTQLAFHAWTEVAGTAVNDRSDVASLYAVFPVEGLAGLARRRRGGGAFV